MFRDWFLVVLFLAKSLYVGQCKDECCYLYGSVPRNDTNCIREGGQLALNYIIYNPRDPFTNLTVTWFRSTTEDMSNYEMIAINSEDSYYSYHILSQSTATLPIGYCNFDIYRDTFSLVINRFTHDKNGYYWCQLSINNTFVQRSHHAWFYASATCSPSLLYFRAALPNETVCVHYNPNIQFAVSSTSTLAIPSTTMPERSSVAMFTSSMTIPSIAVQNTSKNSLIYVLGGFSALLFITLLGVVVLSLLFTLYVCHLRKKTNELRSGEVTFKQQENFDNRADNNIKQEVTAELEQEYDEICTMKYIIIERESSAYQALNLDEMNYESMYVKVRVTKK